MHTTLYRINIMNMHVDLEDKNVGLKSNKNLTWLILLKVNYFINQNFIFLNNKKYLLISLLYIYFKKQSFFIKVWMALILNYFVVGVWCIT